DAGNYLLGGTETYLARFNDAQQESLTQMARLDSFSRDEPELQSTLANLRQVVTAVFELLSQALRVPADRRADEAVRLAGPGRMRLLVDETLRTLGDFDTELMRRLEDARQASRAESRRAMIIVIGANVFLGGLLASLILASSRQPVRRQLAASEQRY